jgi:hypothetical protein
MLITNSSDRLMGNYSPSEPAYTMSFATTISLSFVLTPKDLIN